MKCPSAYYLLLIYAIAICKPILPLVNDALAHTFWATEHLETIHHNHGKNHLGNDLKEAARQDNADSNSNNTKNLESISVHVAIQYHFDFSDTISPSQNLFYNTCALAHTFLEKHTPPPKA